MQSLLTACPPHTSSDIFRWTLLPLPTPVWSPSSPCPKIPNSALGLPLCGYSLTPLGSDSMYWVASSTTHRVPMPHAGSLLSCGISPYPVQLWHSFGPPRLSLLPFHLTQWHILYSAFPCDIRNELFRNKRYWGKGMNYIDFKALFNEKGLDDPLFKF